MSQITLVSARAGLTNYYHNQFVRNQAMDIHSTLIDALTYENHSGGVKGATLMHTAVMSGGLNAQPNGVANIQGNWNESKGLMMLDFLTQDSHVLVEYMHVLGYVSNNESLEGLTMSAIFHPVMSWKTQETITSNFGDISDPTKVKRQIGKRTDYMFNDGSSDDSLVTLRPADVMEFGLESATANDVMMRMEEEGLNAMQPRGVPAASSISRVGVIASKRDNNNPSSYAADILKAGTNYQRNSLLQANSMDNGETSQYDGMYAGLTELSYQSQQYEPQLLRDDFFREMMEQMGQNQTRGFTGYSIGDLLMSFENLNEVLDLTFMSAEQFAIEDYTQTTEQFGTSSLAEIVAAEIEANMLDLMLKYGLNGISLRGSNCDSFEGDGGLDNVVILPHSPAALQEDDYTLGQKIDAFVESLKSQIFTKLNGINPQSLTPIRFNITAELFGTTQMDIQVVNDTNSNGGFMLEDTAAPVGVVRSFPTFANNATSPVLGTTDSAHLAGANFFSNLEAYFQ